MIIALKKDIRKEEQEHLISWLESYGVRTHISEGEFQTVIGLVGDTTRIDTDLISGLDIVQSVTRISEPTLLNISTTRPTKQHMNALKMISYNKYQNTFQTLFLRICQFTTTITARTEKLSLFITQ